MKRADDDNAGEAGAVGAPPACGGRAAQMKRADDNNAGEAGVEERRK
jgi:hypothetical protein